jgi:hypothetical protein
MMRARPFAAVLLIATFLALPVRAQEKEVRTIPFEGPEIVCHILHGFEMKPVEQIEEATDDPTQTVIIVFGNPKGFIELHKATGDLKQFLRDGGNLLIATDHPVNDRDLRILIRGEPVRVSEELRHFYGYRGETQCPKLMYVDPLSRVKDKRDGPAEDFLQNQRDVRDHPLFRFLQKEIATNCPSYVDVFEDRTSRQELQDLLIFPGNDFDMWARWNLRGGRKRYMVGSAKDASPTGRELYIAGQGMFMNGMMLQTDNDNFAFTVNAVRWLREGPDGTPRTKALFIVDGEIITDFNMKLTPPLPPIPVPPVKALNRLIRGLENERFFHRLLADLMGDWRSRFIGILLGLTTLIVLLYGTKKFLAGRYHLETAVPQLLGPQPAPPLAAPLEQRQQAMMRQGDFWEASRHLALEWFRQEFDVTPDQWRGDVQAEFHVEGFFWTRWRLQRVAGAVLQVARTEAPMRMSRHAFFVLAATLRELSQARADGRLTLLVEGKNVRQS